MKIEKDYGYALIFEIDPAEEGFENLTGHQIDLLYIAPEHRGKGRAIELMNEIISFYGEGDLHLICCPKEQDMSFDRLISFYEGLGFALNESAGEMPYPLMSR
jgi:GNAT superfamily N-acetyltransferase